MIPHDAIENTSSTARTSLAIGPASSTRLHTSRPEPVLANGTGAKVIPCGRATISARRRRTPVMLSHGFAARQRNAHRSVTVPVLRTLRIRDLAILDDVTVEFGDGLNVLTGETGAGKSILVDALGLVAGARG